MGDDNALAHEISSFDPLADTSGAHAESSEALRKSEFVPTVAALPPEMRPAIEGRLNGLSGEPRATLEAKLVTEAIRQRALDVRISQGAGSNADAYQREKFEMANQLRTLDREQARIMAELAVFDGFTTEIDPTSGEPMPKKIWRCGGDARTANELRLRDIVIEMDHIQGAEGDRRLAAALKQAVATRRGMQDDLNILNEAKRRAADNAREERINTLADGFAKSHRTKLG